MLRLVVEVFAVVLIQLFTMLGLLMQWMPSIVRGVLTTLRVFMAVSCVLYRALMNLVAPTVRTLGIEITTQPWRSLVAALMSLGIGAAACAAAGLMVTAWVIAGLCVHGLVVGFVWDQLALPDGQSIGR